MQTIFMLNSLGTCIQKYGLYGSHISDFIVVISVNLGAVLLLPHAVVQLYTNDDSRAGVSFQGVKKIKLLILFH